MAVIIVTQEDPSKTSLAKRLLISWIKQEFEGLYPFKVKSLKKKALLRIKMLIRTPELLKTSLIPTKPHVSFGPDANLRVIDLNRKKQACQFQHIISIWPLKTYNLLILNPKQNEKYEKPPNKDKMCKSH